MTSMKRISVLLFVLLGLGITQLSCARKVEQPKVEQPNVSVSPNRCDSSTDQFSSSVSPPPNDPVEENTTNRSETAARSPQDTDSNYSTGLLPSIHRSVENESAMSEMPEQISFGSETAARSPQDTDGSETAARSPQDTESNSSGGLGGYVVSEFTDVPADKRVEIIPEKPEKISVSIPKGTNMPISIGSRPRVTLTQADEIMPEKPEKISVPIPKETNMPISIGSRPRDTLVPLINKTQPLPHDGLFIRRNNEFGTKLDVGIKDSIDQGVLIDQTLIRFDDFVALNSDGVPLPQSGQSLAVSYGIAPIPLSQKRDDRATHYLEIALRASDVAPAGHRKTQAPPVNYIFVIDTSGSMSGEKLDTVKTAIRELFNRTRTDDVLGIVEFNDQPRTLLKATTVGKISCNEFSRIISNLTADGGTDLNIGLSYGINEIGRYESDAYLKHIFLFSDGQPSSGERDWIKIRQNVDKKTRGDIRLSTFAFGTDANTRELDALAGLTGGKSNFIADPTDTEEIHLSLQEELNRREQLAGMNVQLKVEIDRDIPIYHLYGHDLITDPRRRAAVLQDLENVKKEAEAELGVTPAADIVTEEKGIRIFVPDLAVGETYWVVFELAIPEGKRQSPVGKTTVQYVDTFARKNRKSEFQLSASGKLSADLVVEHALGLWTSEVVFYALEDLYQKDVDTAQKRMEKHVASLSAANDKLSSEQIADDKITLTKFASLAENLGKVKATSDGSSQPSNILLIHGLDEFGKVRNGYLRQTYSPNP